MQHDGETHSAMAALLASALDASPVPAMITDGRVVLFVNAQARKLFKAEERSLIEGRSVYDVVHPDGHDAMRLRAEVLKKSSQSLHGLPVKLVALDGSPFNLIISATPIDAPAGRVIMFTAET